MCMSNYLEYEEVSWKDIVSKNNQLDFIVSGEQFKQVLHEVNDTLDEDGFIIDTSTEQREVSKDGDDIRLEQIGGLLTGSKVFVKKNIASFSEHLIEKKMRN